MVKPKCVWEVADFLKNCKQTVEKCKQIRKLKKSATSQTHFGLTLTILGQICTITELQPFEISNFQIKPPVIPRIDPLGLYQSNV